MILFKVSFLHNQLKKNTLALTPQPTPKMFSSFRKITMIPELKKQGNELV